MALAQHCTKAIDLGEGAVGLISYMRTDSTNVSELAQAEAASLSPHATARILTQRAP